MPTNRNEVPPELIRDFDHHVGLAVPGDPFEAFERLRGQPMVWSPQHDGFWITTTVDGYRDVLRQPDAFTTEFGSSIPIPPRPRKLIPMNVDGEAHVKYRQVLSPLFSPAAVAVWAPEVREACGELIDAFRDDGRCDFIWQYARIIPLRVFTTFMALDPSSAGRWTEWHWQLGRPSTDDERLRSGAFVIDQLRQLIEERAPTTDAGDDIPRLLLRSRIDDRLLTQDEVLEILWNLFIAALDTTSASLTYFMYFLALNDDVRHELSGNLSLVPSALEELLRLHSFVISDRVATRDIDIGEVHVKSGDFIMLPTTIASRDPSEFDCPEEFRIDRFPNRHLAFGSGPHRCLGSHLARMELRIALEEWHRRIPDYRLPADMTLQRRGGHLFAIDDLHLEWDVVADR